MPDPIKDMMTQGVAQVGAMNMQLATALAGMATQTASGLNMMASSMAAAAPDLTMIAPAGMPMLPQMPSMGGVPMGVPAAAPAAALPPVTTTRYGARMIV
jgi:hypothetical protein